MNSQPLPALQQQLLDEDTISCLVRDLGAFASILEIRGKSGQSAYATLDFSTVADAVAGLRSGLARGVQIRYLFEQREWLDTLLATPAGIRLTRLAVEDTQSSD